MPVITFASSKGGPGKTTAAGCLASFYCQKKASITLIDADTTRALSRWWKRAEEKNSLLAQSHLIECTDEDKILSTIRNAAKDHDYVLVDCAGAAARMLVYAVGLSDLVIIPVQPGEADLVEAIKTQQIIEQASELTGRTIVAKVLFNRIDMRTIVGKHTISQATSQGLSIFHTKWTDRVTFREGPFSGSSPLLDAPKSPAAKEISDLAYEIEKITSN